MLRIIQSIPSKKAEPIKQWLSEVGAQRIDQMIDPELTFQDVLYFRIPTFRSRTLILFRVCVLVLR